MATAVTSYTYPTAIGTATIANAASLSDAVDLQGCRLTGLRFPAAWTAASVTFQVSEDDVTYGDLYNDSGEVTYSTAAASRCISLLAEDFLSWRYVKVRSGTSGAAVNQGADRTLVLVGSALA